MFFPGPASVTGEDVAELHLHGGRAVIEAVVNRLAGIEGLKPAAPGEFTKRAFINHKLDLTQVEGLADLVAADTESQRRQALRQADGALRDLYEGWRARLVETRARLEAGIDFSDEDDVPEAIGEHVWGDLKCLADEIGAHLNDSRRGERLRDGAEIVVLGPPNAGKSSLVNALARRDVAIVNAEPGTTRDMIEVHLDLEGIPVTVVDTAGLREAKGAVEAEGIRRAEARARYADLVVALSDVRDGVGEAADEIPGPVIRVGGKIDLIDSEEERLRLRKQYDLAVSSLTGEGLDELCERIAGVVASDFGGGESALITRARYREALETCRDAIVAAGTMMGTDELRAEELRLATDSLGRITGMVDVEDLLDVIFSEFCIGK